MAKVEIEQVFLGNIEKVFSGISQYPSYPKYLPGVTAIEVLPAKLENSTCQVRYELHLIKKFYYVLDMFAENPQRIWWQLADSNLMKSNAGNWTFTKISDDKTKALYSLDVKFRGLVPSSITDQLAKANLPAMMDGFQKMIKDHAG